MKNKNWSYTFIFANKYGLRICLVIFKAYLYVLLKFQNRNLPLLKGDIRNYQCFLETILNIFLSYKNESSKSRNKKIKNSHINLFVICQKNSFLILKIKLAYYNKFICHNYSLRMCSFSLRAYLYFLLKFQNRNLPL